MKTPNISYLRNHLSEVISFVKEGETVLVLDRNKPVAYLSPYRAEGETLTPRLDDLQKQGLLRHHPSALPPDLPKPLKIAGPVDLARMIVEERDGH